MIKTILLDFYKDWKLLSWILRICFFKFPLWFDAIWQYGQLKGFSPVWIRICWIRSEFFLNFLPQEVQSFGPISRYWNKNIVEKFIQFISHGRLCIFVRCLVKFPLIFAEYEQYEHWNGFSPVWMRRCLLRSFFSLNCLPHVGQGFEFGPRL